MRRQQLSVMVSIKIIIDTCWEIGMKLPIVATIALVTTICMTAPASSADSEHIRQLLETKECQRCDLSSAGLVLANLSGATLRGANLSGANLSRANLSGADLRGANLNGASLFGANLSGAKLSGADLSGVDFRESYLVNADLTSANVSGANFQAAIGIPSQVGKAEDFYTWGMAEAQKGEPNGAIEHFNQALSINPKFAPAYMARSVARYQLLDRPGAIQDAQLAEQLFLAQGNISGSQTAQTYIKELQTLPSTPKSDSGFMSVLGGIASFALQFLL